MEAKEKEASMHDQKIEAKEDKPADRDDNSTPLTEDLRCSEDSPAVFSTPISSLEGKPDEFEVDPFPSLTFQQRLDYEKKEDRAFYQKIMSRASSKTTRFQDAAEDVFEILNNPKAKLETANELMNELLEAWKSLKSNRKYAISRFSYWTRAKDTYLHPKKALYQKAKNDFLKSYVYYQTRQGMKNEDEEEEERELLNFSPQLQKKKKKEEQQVFYCQYCAGPGFPSVEKLQEHEKTHLRRQPSPEKQPTRRLTSAFWPIVPQPTSYFQQQSRPELNPFNRPATGGSTWVQSQQYTQQPSTTDVLETMTYEGLPVKHALKTSQGNPGMPTYENQSNFQRPHQERRSTIRPLQPERSYELMERPRQMYYGNDPTQEGLLKVAEVMAETVTNLMKSQEENRMRESRRQEDHRIKIEQRQAELNFQKESELLCRIFNPDKITDHHERLHTFMHWLTDLKILEDRMEELNFSGVRKYQTLRLRLAGEARNCTWIEFPTDDSYDIAKNKTEGTLLFQIIGN